MCPSADKIRSDARATLAEIEEMTGVTVEGVTAEACRRTREKPRTPHGRVRTGGKWPWVGQPAKRPLAVLRIRARRRVVALVASCIERLDLQDLEGAREAHQELLDAAVAFWDAIDTPSDVHRAQPSDVGGE